MNHHLKVVIHDHFHRADFLETCTCTLYTYLPLCIVYTSTGILDDNVIIFYQKGFIFSPSVCLSVFTSGICMRNSRRRALTIRTSIIGLDFAS